jgi:hypothetical protein
VVGVADGLESVVDRAGEAGLNPGERLGIGDLDDEIAVVGMSSGLGKECLVSRLWDQQPELVQSPLPEILGGKDRDGWLDD